MNCRECQDWLQRSLDDGRLIVGNDVNEHLRACDPCRRDVAAARVFLGGMREVTKPEASQLLTASITAAIRADRVQRRRRNTYGWVVTSALAASILLLIGFGYLSPKGTQGQVVVAPGPKAPEKTPDKAPVQLARQAEDAQNAVASLTRSMSETTRSRLKVFLPDRESLQVRIPTPPEFDEQIDPAAKSLKEAGLSVAHSFDPLARTTVRALDYFAREMPAIDLSKN